VARIRYYVCLECALAGESRDGASDGRSSPLWFTGVVVENIVFCGELLLFEARVVYSVTRAWWSAVASVVAGV
jgi:hypothetical protein